MRLGFPVTIIAGVVLFLGTAAGIAYYVIEDPETARNSYHKLLQVANPINSRQESPHYTAKQKREGIQKSFYFTPSNVNAPQELRLFASNSELIMTRGEESTISERLEDLRSMIQESLYYVSPDGKESSIMCEGCIPMQKITYISGETADCHYTHATLDAHRAEITRFTLPGHILISDLQAANINPYQSASAERVHLRYKEGLLTLTGNVSIDHHEGRDLLQLTCDNARLFQENKIPVVEADQHVTLVFNNSFTANGEFARFADDNVYLLGSDQGKQKNCHVSSISGDKIASNRIDLALKSKILKMTNPEGRLYPVKGDLLPLQFSSRQLLWNHEQNQLVLHSDVAIYHPTLGRLTNEDEVHVFRSTERGGALEKIISEGHTILTRNEPQTQRFYTLTCDGRVVLDHLEGQVKLVAADPVNAPVHLKDDFGEIYSNSARIVYTPTQSRQQTPQRVILTGNVKIINRNGPADDPASVEQMALADRVELNPTTNKMIFFANKKKRVLFYDKGNDLQISATKLTVHRDQQTKKESFEGSGDVRFSFQDKEIARLREKFSLPFTNNKDKK